MARIKAATVSAYIAAAPPEARKHLRAIRGVLRKVAPKATEAIKWGLPVLEERRILFAYAAYRTNLNFMPTPSAMKPFKKDLVGYHTGKGSIRFPYDQPLPTALIRRIAAQRVRELRDNDAEWM